MLRHSSLSGSFMLNSPMVKTNEKKSTNQNIILNLRQSRASLGGNSNSPGPSKVLPKIDFMSSLTTTKKPASFIKASIDMDDMHFRSSSQQLKMAYQRKSGNHSLLNNLERKMTVQKNPSDAMSSQRRFRTSSVVSFP